jgi:hypothetical protein
MHKRILWAITHCEAIDADTGADDNADFNDDDDDDDGESNETF